MAAQVDLSSPAGKALSRNMRTAFTEAQSLSALGIGAVALAGYEEVLLNLTVAAIFPDIGGRLLEPQPDCGSAATRRARDYLREHASELVEISQLAESLGVSMRSLQESFRRQFGVSPREYLFDCRLENARKLLLASDSASVTSVALNSGFNDLSQFAAKYQGRYGELPSKTFRRIRGGINAMAENALIIAPLP